MSSKAKIFEWLSNKIITEDTQNYFDAFLQVGEERTSIPDSKIDEWYGGEKRLDVRSELVGTIEDVLIIDGMSLLYSPFTNYSILPEKKFTLLDENESRLPNGSIKTTLANLGDRILILLENMMKQRPNLRLIALCFDKFAYHYPPKEENWNKRKENSAENSFCNAYSLDQPLKPDNFIVGCDTEGRYDYYTGLYDRKNRMNILSNVTKYITRTLRAVKRDSPMKYADILIDTYGKNVDSYESVSESTTLGEEDVVYLSYDKTNFIYNTKPVSTDMYKRSYNIIEADTMIQKIIFYAIESCSKIGEKKILIEIIGNDADNLINTLLSYHLFRNFYGVKVDLFYRQIGGNSAHRFFGIPAVYKILMKHMTKYFRYKKSASEIISRQMTNRRIADSLAMTDFLLFNVMSGTDYVNNMRSVGYATLIKKWYKILSHRPRIEVVKDRLPFVIDYNRRIVRCNENEAKLFVLFLIGAIKIGDYVSPTTSIEKKIQNFAEKNLTAFNERIKRLIESLPVLLFISDCETIFKNSDDTGGIEEILRFLAATPSTPEGLANKINIVARRFIISRDNSKVNSFDAIFERLKEFDSLQELDPSGDTLEKVRKDIEIVSEYYNLVAKYMMNIQPIWYSIAGEFANAKNRITMDYLIQSFDARINRNLNPGFKKKYADTLKRYKGVFFSNLKKIGMKLDTSLMEQKNCATVINEFIMRVWWNLIHIVCGGTWNFTSNNFYLNDQAFGFDSYSELAKLKDPISAQKQYYIQLDSARIKPSISVPNVLDFYSDFSKLNAIESDNLPTPDIWDPIVPKNRDFLRRYPSISIKSTGAFQVDFVRNYASHWIHNEVVMSLEASNASGLPHSNIPFLEDSKLYTLEASLKKSPSLISEILEDNKIEASKPKMKTFNRSEIQKFKINLPAKLSLEDTNIVVPNGRLLDKNDNLEFLICYTYFACIPDYKNISATRFQNIPGFSESDVKWIISNFDLDYKNASPNALSRFFHCCLSYKISCLPQPLSWRYALALIVRKDAGALKDEFGTPLTLRKEISTLIVSATREIPPEGKTLGNWTQILFVIYRIIFDSVPMLDVLCSSMPLTKQGDVAFEEKYNIPITTTKYVLQKGKNREKDVRLFGDTLYTKTIKRDFDGLDYDVITNEAKSPLIYWWLTRKLVINSDYMIDEFEFADDLMNILNLPVVKESDLKSFMTWIFNIHNILRVTPGTEKVLSILMVPDDRDFVRYTFSFEDKIRYYESNYAPFLKKNAFSLYAERPAIYTQFPKVKLNENEYAYFFPYIRNYFGLFWELIDSEKTTKRKNEGGFSNKIKIIESQYLPLYFWNNTLISTINLDDRYYHPVINGVKYITLERTVSDGSDPNATSFTILGLIQDTSITIGKVDVVSIYNYLSTYGLINPSTKDSIKMPKFRIWGDYDLFLDGFFNNVLNRINDTDYKVNLNFYLDILDYLGSNNHLTEINLITAIEKIEGINEIKVKCNLPFIPRIVEFILDKLRIKFTKYLKYNEEGTIARKNYMLHKLIHQFYIKENKEDENLKRINVTDDATRIESLFRALRTGTDKIYFVSEEDERNGTVDNFCVFIRYFTAKYLREYTPMTNEEVDIINRAESPLIDKRIKERLAEYCEVYEIFEVISRKDAIQKGVSLDEYITDLFDESEKVIASLYKIDDINKAVMARAVAHAQSLEFFVDAETFEEMDSIKSDWQDYFSDYKDQDNEIARLNASIDEEKEKLSEARSEGKREKMNEIKRKINSMKSEIDDINDKRIVGKEIVSWMQSNADSEIILNERSFYYTIYRAFLSLSKRVKNKSDIDLTTQMGKFQADALLNYPIQKAIQRVKDFDPFYPKLIVQRSKINPEGKVTQYYTFSYKPTILKPDMHLRYSALQSFAILMFMFQMKVKLKIDGWLKVRDYEGIKNWYNLRILKHATNKNVNLTDVFELIEKKALTELNGIDEIMKYFVSKSKFSMLVYKVTWADKKVKHFEVEVQTYDADSDKDHIFAFLCYIRKTPTGDVSHFEPLEWIENIPEVTGIIRRKKESEEEEESESESDGEGGRRKKSKENKPEEPKDKEKKEIGKKLDFDEPGTAEENELADVVKGIEEDSKKKAKEKNAEKEKPKEKTPPKAALPPAKAPKGTSPPVKSTPLESKKKEKGTSKSKKKANDKIVIVKKNVKEKTGKSKDKEEDKAFDMRNAEIAYVPIIEGVLHAKVRYLDGYLPYIALTRESYGYADMLDENYTFLYKHSHKSPNDNHHKVITGVLSLLYLISPSSFPNFKWMTMETYEEIKSSIGYGVEMGDYAIDPDNKEDDVLDVFSEAELASKETVDSLMNYFVSKLNVGIILYSVNTENGLPEKLECEIKEYKNEISDVAYQFAFLYYSNIIEGQKNDHFEPLIWINKTNGLTKTTHPTSLGKIITPTKPTTKKTGVSPPRPLDLEKKAVSPPKPPENPVASPPKPKEKEKTPPPPAKETVVSPPKPSASEKSATSPPKQPEKKAVSPPKPKEKTPPPPAKETVVSPPKPSASEKSATSPPKQPEKKVVSPPKPKESVRSPSETTPSPFRSPSETTPSPQKTKEALRLPGEASSETNPSTKETSQTTLIQSGKSSETERNIISDSQIALKEKIKFINRIYKNETLLEFGGSEDIEDLPEKRSRKKTVTFGDTDSSKKVADVKKDPSTVNSYFGELTVGSMLKVIDYMINKGWFIVVLFV